MQTLETIRRKMNVLCVSKVKVCDGLDITYDGVIENSFELNKVDEVIVIPDGATSMESRTLKHLTEAKEIILPDSLVGFSPSTFMGICLTKLNIPKNIKTIGSGSFKNCKIDVITFSDDSRVKTIGKNAFSEAKVRRLTLPRGYTVINESAFANSEIDTVVFEGCSIKIKADAFMESCVRVIKSDSIEEVGYCAFGRCRQLVNIDLTNVKIIRAYAFDGCKSLKSIDLRNCEDIRAGAFIGAELDIAIMNEQINIADSAFQKSKIKRLISSKQIYNQLKKEAEILDWVDISVLLG